MSINKDPSIEQQLIDSMDKMETGLYRVSAYRDIWQNDLIYAICESNYRILKFLIKYVVPAVIKKGN